MNEFSTLNFSVMKNLAALFSVESPVCLLMSGSPSGSPGAFPVCSVASKLSEGKKRGQIVGLTSFVFHLLGLVVCVALSSGS